MADRSEIFKSNTLSILRTFRDFWYRIPAYQRPYVWESETITELLSDIHQAMSSNSKSTYFLGIILLRKHTATNGTDYIEYDVIDGQQRLITLFLTFAVMRDAVIKIKDEAKSSEDDLSEDDINKFIKSCQTSIQQEENSFENIPERARILFQIRNDVDDFINNYLNRKKGTLDIIPPNNDLLNKYKNETSIKHMCSAIRVIRDFFSEYNFKYSDFDAFLTYIFNYVLTVSITSSHENLSDTHKIFETLNTRGLELRPSDILKSQNLEQILVSDMRNKYSRKWDEFENNLDNYFEKDQSYFDSLLSHIRTILRKEKAEKSLLKEFEEKIYPHRFNDLPHSLTKGESTLECIEKYYDLFTKLFSNNFKTNDSYTVNNLIALMKGLLPSDYWIAALLMYYDKFNEQNLADFLIRLDNKVSYDWIVKETPTTRIVNINKILKELDKVGNSKKIDPKKISDFLKNDCFKIDLPKFENTLDDQEIYHTRHVKYLVHKLNFLDNNNTSKWNITTRNISIEHILPQKPDKSSQWVHDFKDDERVTWTHKLGNLILIDRRKNANLSNKDFTTKKETYFKGNIESNLPYSMKIYQYSTWAPKDLANNHEESIDKLLAHYKLNPH
ncbi:hypothetical protein COTS27_01531 [Spirochaetota bacterium]|nr:hypothetical protein COTS27_01531 [Spirochaetota bacterium]